MTRDVAVGMILAAAVICALLGLPLPLLLLIWAMQACGLLIVLNLRVVDPPQPAPAPAGL
jgi:hypothetical protein